MPCAALRPRTWIWLRKIIRHRGSVSLGFELRGWARPGTDQSLRTRRHEEEGGDVRNQVRRFLSPLGVGNWPGLTVRISGSAVVEVDGVMVDGLACLIGPVHDGRPSANDNDCPCGGDGHPSANDYDCPTGDDDGCADDYHGAANDDGPAHSDRTDCDVLDVREQPHTEGSVLIQPV